MSTPAGWYPDPTGRHEHRWWDGSGWSDQVADRGTTSTDPVDAGGPAKQLDPDATQIVSMDQIQAAAGPTPTATQPAGAAPGTAPDGGSSGNRGKLIAIGAAVLVGLVIIVVVAVALLGGDDDDESDAGRDRDSSEEQADDEEDSSDDLSVSDLFGEEDDGDSGDDSDPPPDDSGDDSTGDDSSGGDEYPQIAIDNFMSSCSAGAPEDVCRCIIDVLQRDVPFDRFVELDQQLQEDPTNVPPELNAAVDECR